VLAYGAGVSAGPIGERETFADIGQSLAAFFALSPMEYGASFLK
jgi:phosphopentomutase